MSLTLRLETVFKENPNPWALRGLPGLPSHCYICEEAEPEHSDGCLWLLGKDALVEIARLEQRIDDSQSGMRINCVYCGYRYGPDDGDHLNSMRDALRAHIERCSKHPMSLLKQRYQHLLDQVRTVTEAHNTNVMGCALCVLATFVKEEPK